MIIEGAHVVTVTGEEYPDGHVVVEGNRITAVGPGPAPVASEARIDGRGCLLTPGFVNTHNHLYQWVTRGLAVDATLFEWLTTLYPVWAGIDEHAVHTGATGTGVAHCPSSNARLGAGICRTRDLRDAGARVGLGVDGAASNEAGSLLEEVRHAVLFARAVGGPTALTVRDALALATMGGAAVLGRAGEIGSIEPGKLADLALWRIDGLAHLDVADPVAALVLGSPPPLDLLLVDGRPVVECGRVVTVDTSAVARECAAVHRTLLEKAS